MNINRKFLDLMIFDRNGQVICEPTACIIKHCNDYSLSLLLMEYSAVRLTHDTDSLIV